MEKTVLIVDDEKVVRFAFKNCLANKNCKILEASDPQTARDLITKYGNKLDVVILDLRLLSPIEEEAEESGLKILQECFSDSVNCSQCGHNRLKTKVILLTAYPSVASCRAAFLSGAYDYIEKTNPQEVTMKRVLEAINTK